MSEIMSGVSTAAQAKARLQTECRTELGSCAQDIVHSDPQREHAQWIDKAKKFNSDQEIISIRRQFFNGTPDQLTVDHVNGAFTYLKEEYEQAYYEGLECDELRQNYQYKEFTEIYQNLMKSLAMCLGNLREGAYENEKHLQIETAMFCIEVAMDSMSLDEAVIYAKQTLLDIDENNWRTINLKEAYQTLLQEEGTLQRGLLKALQRHEMSHGKDKKYQSVSNDIARIFTSRADSTGPTQTGNFESLVQDPGFAAEVLKNRLDWGQRSFEYVEEVYSENAVIEGIKSAQILAESMPAEDWENLTYITGGMSRLDMSQLLSITPDGTPEIRVGQYMAAQALVLAHKSLPTVVGPDQLGDFLKRSGKFFQETYSPNLLGDHLDGWWDYKERHGSYVDTPGFRNADNNEIEALKLLADIEGYDSNWSDMDWHNTVSTVKSYARIGASIAVGIAVASSGVALLPGIFVVAGLEAGVNLGFKQELGPNFQATLVNCANDYANELCGMAAGGAFIKGAGRLKQGRKAMEIASKYGDKKWASMGAEQLEGFITGQIEANVTAVTEYARG